jgi:hypothetical protein
VDWSGLRQTQGILSIEKMLRRVGRSHRTCLILLSRGLIAQIFECPSRAGFSQRGRVGRKLLGRERVSLASANDSSTCCSPERAKAKHGVGGIFGKELQPGSEQASQARGPNNGLRVRERVLRHGEIGGTVGAGAPFPRGCLKGQQSVNFQLTRVAAFPTRFCRLGSVGKGGTPASCATGIAPGTARPKSQSVRLARPLSFWRHKPRMCAMICRKHVNRANSCQPMHVEKPGGCSVFLASHGPVPLCHSACEAPSSKP